MMKICVVIAAAALLSGCCTMNSACSMFDVDRSAFRGYHHGGYHGYGFKGGYGGYGGYGGFRR